MITVLEYLVIAAVIALVVFGIAVFVFGRGEQLAALSPRTSPSELPEAVIGGDDVHKVRFGLALRGYRMSDVDWTLDKLADELDRLHRRVAELGGEPVPPSVTDPTGSGELFAATPPGRAAEGAGDSPTAAVSPPPPGAHVGPLDPAPPVVDDERWAPQHAAPAASPFAPAAPEPAPAAEAAAPVDPAAAPADPAAESATQGHRETGDATGAADATHRPDGAGPADDAADPRP